MTSDRTEYRFMAYPHLAPTEEQPDAGVFLGRMNGLDVQGQQAIDELHFTATIMSHYVEKPEPNELHYQSLHITGGEVVVEQRTVTKDEQYTFWIRRDDVPPVHIPGFDERMGQLPEES